MTLTELRYIVAVARERHFGRAAEACFVSQPTLSVAIKKLEDELGVKLFERRQHEVILTPIGKRVIEQARVVLEQAESIKHIAREGQDELAGPLRLGVIYTVGPYLLPRLIPLLHARAPRMTLLIEENYTENLGEKLKAGDLDLILVSQPFALPGVATRALYREPFVVALPAAHPLAKRHSIKAADLAGETMLLLSAGNCFRDQVIAACPDCVAGPRKQNRLQKTLEGSSIETIRHMVGSGAGVTVLPCTSARDGAALGGLLVFRPFARPAPYRDIALAYRETYPRAKTIDLIKHAVQDCPLGCVTHL
jgi:LysR family hydrogen peroxide-inducible transcriptional activator